MSSSLITRPLVSGNRHCTQNNNTISYRNKGGIHSVTFPASIGEKIRKDGYIHLEYKVNEFTGEVFFVLYKTPTQESLELNTETEKYKLTVRSKSLVEFLAQDLHLTGEALTLGISDNLSRIPDCLTFRVFKSK